MPRAQADRDRRRIPEGPLYVPGAAAVITPPDQVLAMPETLSGRSLVQGGSRFLRQGDLPVP